MRKLQHATWLALVLGCTKASDPSAAPAPRPTPPLAPAPAPALAPATPTPPPSPPAPAPPSPPAPSSPLVPPPPSTVQLTTEPLCFGAYSGPYQGFLEDAKRPIATVLVGHYVRDEDVMACRIDDPRSPILSIALPRATFFPAGALVAKVLAGDALRPLFAEECTRVVACDDRNGNGACDLPGEPQLNGYNDRSHYLHASVSRPARFELTMTSRDDRACRGTNYHSRCCPEGYAHYQDSHTCSSMGKASHQVPARCP